MKSSKDRRTYTQVRRILAIYELLSSRERSLSIGEIHAAVGPEFNERTILRDLQVLMMLGRVEPTGGYETKWQWWRSSKRVVRTVAKNGELVQ